MTVHALTQLLGRFRARDAYVRAAVQLLDEPPRGAAEIKLECLLRNHGDVPITSQREIDLREGFDRLLLLYGRVELGVECGVIGELSVDFIESAKRHLGNAHVQRYFQKHYPLALPEAFRLRLLNDGKGWASQDQRNAGAQFGAFLNCSSLLEDDNGVEVFLHLLDDFSWSGYGFRDFLGGLRNPERVAAALVRERNDELFGAAVRGAHTFLTFCAQYDELLGKVSEPVLRSALWHFHSYWFLRMSKKVGTRLAEMLSCFRAWQVDNEADIVMAESVMARLFDPENGKPFDGMLAEAKRLPSIPQADRHETAQSSESSGENEGVRRFSQVDKTMTAAPLNVQFVFHPSSVRASELAMWLHHRLNDDPAVPGLRIPTVFLPNDGTDEPPDIASPPDHAARTAVVVLADDHLAAHSRKQLPGRKSWGEFLVSLRANCERNGHRFIPIQLTEKAWPIDPRLDDLNFLRAWTFDGDKQSAFIARRLVHVLCRCLIDEKDDEREAPVTIFVSHTKLDLESEPKVVRALLDLLTATQPEKTWFDSGDIDVGSRFAAKIEQGVQDSGLIAVLTDSYASRAWCRREVLLAKRHKRPVIVIDALRGGEVRSFPYVGNVPVLRWNGNAQEAVDLLLRETLRHLHATEMLRVRSRPGDVVLPSPPELVTVIGGASKAFLYPDPPLGEEEANVIAAAGVTIETPLERFAKDVGFAHRSHVIALSVSESEDIERYGQRDVHLEAAYLELSRYLLLAGARLAYGGHLVADGYTLRLFDLLKDPIVDRLRRSGCEAGTERKFVEPQIVNYIGWPLPLTVHDEARHGMLVELRRVPRPDGIDERLEPTLVAEPEHRFPADSGSRRFAWARGMTAMRELQTAETTARVVLGGKVGPVPGGGGSWYTSRIPGVLEEVLLSLQQDKPVFIIGAFGGCSRMIFDVLDGRDRIEMGWEYQKRAPHTEAMRALYETHGLSWCDYPEMVQLLRERGLAGLNNGLTIEQNRELSTTRSVERMVELVLLGLKRAGADKLPSD